MKELTTSALNSATTRQTRHESYLPKKRILLSALFDTTTMKTAHECAVITMRYSEATQEIEIYCRHGFTTATKKIAGTHALRKWRTTDEIKRGLLAILNSISRTYSGAKEVEDLYLSPYFKEMMYETYGYTF